MAAYTGPGARIASNNLLTAPGVVISSSSEAVGYVDDNLANAAVWKRWTSAATTSDQWVKFDLGANQPMQLLAAVSATLHPSGTLRVQAHTADVWTTPTIDDLLPMPATDFTHVLADWKSATFNLRWVRFYFTNSATVAAAVSLGVAFAGTYLEPARSIGIALSVQRTDPSVHRVAQGGQRSSVVRTKFHSVAGTFVLQTAAARNDLRRVFEVVGATTPVIFSIDPNDPSLTFYGTLQPTLSAQHSGPDLWDLPIDFVEDVA